MFLEQFFVFKIHASVTELSLQGKSLLDEKTLKNALDTLDKEVQPEDGPLESARDYRVQLTKALLYKVLALFSKS